MTQLEPIFYGLPSLSELHDSPQRAILAALDANLVLAVRVVKARHTILSDCALAEEPLHLLAEAVLASALSLHNVLAAYDELAGRIARWNRENELLERPDSSDMPF
jgi:hypothetical protein